MSKRRWLRRMVIGVLAIPVMIGTMGGLCDVANIGGLPFFDSITVEMVNTTDYYVDPFLYADPEENVYLASQIVQDENYVDVGWPIGPDEGPVSIVLSCDDVGSLIMNYPELLLSDTTYLLSDNAPLLREEDHFECGDTISFIFIQESDGLFYTRVEVNGEFVMD